MSHITSGILGGAAMALMMGAMQFASGSDLRASVTPANATEAVQVSSEAVNRSAKSDRSQVAAAQDGSRTVTYQVHNMPETSMVLRIAPNPVRVEKITPAPETVFAPRSFKTNVQKSAVACEPPVSVLTEIAKLLEPGRCVT